jgi:hypothetical protein
LLKRKEEKMELKKHTEDFSLLTALIVGMSPRTLGGTTSTKA